MSSPKTILLVDDNRLWLQVLSDALAGEGFIVIVAQDGLEAWDLAQREKPDFVVADWFLPKIDGVRLAVYVRSAAALAHTRTILLSGAALEDMPKRTDYQADAYVSKAPLPVVLGHLRGIIERLTAHPERKPQGVAGLEDVYPREMSRKIASLKQHEDLFWNNVWEGAIETDENLRSVRINRSGLNQIGLTEDEVIGRDLGEVLNWQGDQEIMAHLVRLRAAKEPVHTTFTGALANRVFQYRISNFAEGGVFAGAMVIFLDITEQRKREQEFLHRDRLAAVGEIAAAVAHEIRNPLAGLLGMVEIAEMKSLEPRDVAQLLGTLAKEMRRLDGMVNNLLQYSRKPSPARSEFWPHKIMDEIIATNQNVFEARGLLVDRRYDANVTSCLAEENQMRQVFLNLLINAAQASDPGGTITIRSAREEGLLRIAVHNTGKHIEDTDLRKVFSLFFSTKPGGTGLGLAICRKIVEDHGGQIGVTSSAAGGTEFTVSLPAGQDS